VKNDAAPTLRVLQPMGGDPRHEALLVETDHGSRVMKVGRTPDRAAQVVAAAQRLAAVRHPSLRVVHAAGVLADGRPWVLTDVVTAPTLPPSLSLGRALEVGAELASALAAVHAAGVVVGPLEPASVLLTKPAMLDAVLAGLAPAQSCSITDTRALAALLRRTLTDDTALSREVCVALDQAEAASELEQALRQLMPRLSAPSPSVHTEVEVLEPDLSGNQLGSWHLEKVVGEGAMGRVYLATHRRIGRRAAVKVLRAEHATSAELVQRFIQEAQAVNAIKNEHIVEVYDFGEVARPGGPKLVYCVMELLEGEPLAATLGRGPVAVRRVAHIGQQLGRALHAAHQVGVVHRDIKPENIMLLQRVGAADYVKVLDFGVAKLLKPIGDLPRAGTLAGIVVGTPEYMAPEQALGVGVDLRSDLYAVGLVMYELLTGTQPFQADTFGKLVVEMTQKPPPPLPDVTRLGEAVPRGLSAIIYKLLRKEPDARYQSGEALAEALAPFTLEVLPAEPVVDVPVQVPDAPAEPPPQRSRGLGLLAAVLLLGVGAAAGLWAVLRADADQASAPTPPVVAVAVPPSVPMTVWLEVASSPPGARVTRVDTGEVLGVTPLKAAVATAAQTGLSLELEGFEAERREVNLAANASLSVDMRPQLGETGEVPVAAPESRRREEKKKPDKKKVNNDGTVDPFAQ
jgi:tRNA A-37 threonylcarbamoyl transferase component Bud32